MRIVVTGGSGLVGKHLQEILPDAFYLSSKDCDLTDIKKVRWMISSYTPDVVILSWIVTGKQLFS